VERGKKGLKGGVSLTPQDGHETAPTAYTGASRASDRSKMRIVTCKRDKVRQGIVYKIFHTSDDSKCYYGPTDGKLQKRWDEHLRSAYLTMKKEKIYVAMRATGQDGWRCQKVDKARVVNDDTFDLPLKEDTHHCFSICHTTYEGNKYTTRFDTLKKEHD
jgi:hypothetical protein